MEGLWGSSRDFLGSPWPPELGVRHDFSRVYLCDVYMYMYATAKAASFDHNHRCRAYGGAQSRLAMSKLSEQ